jgi:two-component system cell cycle sensor histidine kinase/response regulator CckA
MSKKSRNHNLLQGSDSLRQKLLSRQFTIVMVVALVFLPATLLRAFAIGFRPINAIQVLLCLALLGTYVRRKHSKPEVVSVAIFIIFVAWCFTSGLNYGLLAPANLAVPFITVLSSIVLGHKVAVRFYFTTTVGLVIIGALYLSGALKYQVDVHWYVHSWTSWFILLLLQSSLGLWYLFLIAPISDAQRKTAERLDAVLQGINDALFVHDKDSGAILQVNQKMCALYGCSPEEALRLSIGELSAGIPPYSQEDAAAWLNKAINEGPQLFEWLAKDGAGRLFWVEVNMRLANLEGAERVLVMVRDISARKQAESDLRQVEANMLALIESTDDLIWSVDLDNRYLTFNRKAKEHIRQVYGTETRIGAPPDEIMPADRAAFWKSQFTRALEGGSFRQELVLATGRVHEIALNPIVNAGQKVGVSVFAKDVTERKRGEQVLRESEQKARAIFDLSFGFIGLLTPDGTLVDVNKTALEFAGIGLSDVQGKPFWDTPWWSHSPEMQETIRAAVKRAAEGQLVRSEAIHLAKDGSSRSVEFTLKHILDETGKVTLLIPEGRDITEKREAHEELRASEEKFSRLFHSSPDAILVTRLGAGTIVEVNSAFETFSGYQRAELVGRKVPDLNMYNTTDRERFVTMLRDHGSVRDAEFSLKKRSGVVAPVLASAELIEIKGEQHAITILHDISERKAADFALRESEARFRDAQRIAHVGNWQIDLLTNTFNCSDEIFRIFEIHSAQMTPSFETFQSVIHPEDREGVTLAYKKSLETRKPCAITHRLVMPDGRIKSVQATFATQCSPDGVAIQIVGTIQDVSERVQLEEQLRQSQKMEAIGSLAGGVAHDFNNLLSVILNHAEFAMDGVPKDGPVMDDLLEVTKASGRAAALTRQLLAFSRKQVLQPVSLNLNEIAVGVEKLLRRILGEDIDIVQVLRSDLGMVRADPGQIEQVLLNLAVNARDAMPNGGKLTIETSNFELDSEYAAHHMSVLPGSYVQLAVTDTGFGMDDKTKQRIFEPFFTTKEKGRGTGLGLSTVYGIIKQSGGSIWVYSELGHGTTFKIYLPRELTVTESIAPRPSRFSPLTAGTETILVVEDEEALLRVAERILGAAGYRVLLAANGDQALQMSANHAGPIDLLLTDVVMPRMNGRVLAEKLVQVRPDMKVIFMSGYTDNAIVHHGVLDAGTHFINKPIGAAELTRRIREVLDG